MSNLGKDLLGFIKSKGLDGYGAVIPVEVVRLVIGLEYPETGTQKEYNSLQLTELAAVDYVRNALLNEGKYLKLDGMAYRILLPSENAGQIALYMQSAEKKLKRALKLNRNTPVENRVSDNTSARAMLKIKSIRGEIE